MAAFGGYLSGLITMGVIWLAYSRLRRHGCTTATPSVSTLGMKPFTDQSAGKPQAAVEITPAGPLWEDRGVQNAEPV